MYEIKAERQLEFLRWVFSTLDGQWLIKTSAAYSPADSLKLSGKVRGALGKSEMRAMLALLGKNKADNLADAVEIIKTFLQLAYGERGFAGVFRNGQGANRIEIEITKWNLLENLRKAASGSNESLSLTTELLWSSWFETLLPDTQVEVAVQFAGSGGRSTDLFSIVCFSEDEGQWLAASEPAPQASMPPTAVVPTPAPVTVPPAELSPIAAALQMPLEDKPVESSDYTSYTPPAQAFNVPLPLVAESVPPVAPPTSLPTPPPAPTGGSLAQRLASKRQQETPAVAEPAAPSPEMIPLIHYDTKTAKPLFSEDIDKKVKETVERRELKRNKLMQKIFISKEARELLDKGAEQEIVPEFSLAMGIENELQKLITRENMLIPDSITEIVHVVAGPDGELQIQVGNKVYSAIGDIPESRVKQLLQQAVQEWGDSNSR